MQRRQLNIKGNSSERLKTIIPDVLSQLSDIKHVWGGRREKKESLFFHKNKEESFTHTKMFVESYWFSSTGRQTLRLK